MLDSFIVKQDRSQDTTVEVYEDVVKDWPRDEKALRFETDQSLNSPSDRASKVLEAIKEYAQARGYFDNATTFGDSKFNITLTYNRDRFSGWTEYNLRQEIIASDRYQAALAQVKQQEKAIAAQYGQAIQQIKNLLTALDEACESKLDILREEMKAVQASITSEMDIPEHVNETDRERLLAPRWPYYKVERDHYSDYGQGTYGQGNGILPDDLEKILALL